MAELKTKATTVKVEDFINKVPDEQKRKDSYELLSMMKKITGEEPKMWGPSIIGFRKYHYKYDSGHEGEMCITGFSPRKAALTVYAVDGTQENKDLLGKLGKHKASKACLYIKRLSDVDKRVLEQIIKKSVEYVKKTYPNK